jgi:hypothetical protein
MICIKIKKFYMKKSYSKKDLKKKKLLTNNALLNLIFKIASIIIKMKALKIPF